MWNPRSFGLRGFLHLTCRGHSCRSSSVPSGWARTTGCAARHELGSHHTHNWQGSSPFIDATGPRRTSTAPDTKRTATVPTQAPSLIRTQRSAQTSVRCSRRERHEGWAGAPSREQRALHSWSNRHDTRLPPGRCGFDPRRMLNRPSRGCVCGPSPAQADVSRRPGAELEYREPLTFTGCPGG